MSYNDKFYRDMEKVANDGVLSFGTQAFLLRYSQGEPGEPANPWEGVTEPGQIVTAYPCHILIGSYSAIEKATFAAASQSVPINYSKIMIAKKDLEIEPTVTDLIQLTDHDRAFQIDNVRAVMPGGHVIYWEVMAR